MNLGSGGVVIINNINAPVFGVDDLDQKIDDSIGYALQGIRRNVRSLGG